MDGYNTWSSAWPTRAATAIVATRIDGRPLPLGGLGPQWSVYDPQTLPAFKDKPLKKDRFGLSLGLCHIDVKSA